MIREFFYLRKSDRKVILALLAVIVLALGVLTLGGEQNSQADGLTAADSVQPWPQGTARRQTRRQSEPYYVTPRRVERFAFDPNTADSTQLLRLGLQPWQVRNVYKYRAAGGVYRRADDFARLYGLTQKQFRELKPYIRISPDYQPLTPPERYAGDPKAERDTVKYPAKIQPLERIALNQADTTLLRRVPGIGPYFAAQIVGYRQRLGGYYSVGQLMEIEDFPEAALSYFVIPDDAPTRKLNVNKLSLNELKRHPYINFYQARAIADYRRLHGNLRSLYDLRLSKDFPPAAIERLLPYVEY